MTVAIHSEIPETPEYLADFEVWKTHPTWTNFEVSTQGNVRNKTTGRLVGFLSGPPGGRTKGKRYLRVTVRSSTPKRSVNVNVLVLETFVGPRPDDHEADHINHDCLDNRLSNLRWRPLPENRADIRP